MAYRAKKSQKQRELEAEKTVVSDNYVAQNKPSRIEKVKQRTEKETTSTIDKYAALQVTPKLGLMQRLLLHTPAWVLNIRLRSAFLLIALSAIASPFIVIFYVTMAYLVLIFIASFAMTNVPSTIAETMGTNSAQLSTSLDSLFTMQVVPAIFVATALAIIVGVALYKVAKFLLIYMLSMWAPLFLPREVSAYVATQRGVLDNAKDRKPRKHLVDLVAKD